MKKPFIFLFILFILSGCTAHNEPKKINEINERNDQMINSTGPEKSGIVWPKEQVFPEFGAPAKMLYTVHTSNLTPDERVTVSALQGIVNKTEPRILLMEDGDVLPDTWAKTFNLNTSKIDPYSLIEKFKNEINGLVIYDKSKSAHYRNAAATAANLSGGYLPVTAGIYKALERQGITFEGKDIKYIDWQLETPLEIYGKLYDEYWPHCSKRLILSANPADTGDLDHCRDIAAAAGAAVIWLDCTKENERGLYLKFMRDMAENREINNETAIVLGWFTTERSGVTAGSEYGISTIPADLYISGSVYGGVSFNDDPKNRSINIPAVPKKKDIENKAYIAVFFTDGDNIQYVQRFMRKLWDSQKERDSRGKVPANWTIAPGLVDIGPGILNYFYSLAGDFECFVAGPSGMGYLMPINTNREPGVKLADYLTERKYMDEYTKLTDRYMHKAGLRVLTVWDDAGSELRKSYEQNCRYLYGATIQNFGAGSVEGGAVNNRLYFIKHETHYEGVYDTVLTDMTKKIRAWETSGNNGTKPLFLSYQVKTWEFQTPQLVRLHDEIKKQFEGAVEIEFVRADHFFALYNEAHGMPFNLCMNEKTKITSDDSFLTFDFGGIYAITRCFTAAAPIRLELSENGADWTSAAGSGADFELEKPVNARYARIAVNSSVLSGDVEIYGCAVN